MILFLLMLAIAYVMGSICSAILVCRLSGLPDPRLEGSKNPGATNVLRLAGKGYAALVLLTDMLKGTIPVLLAQLLLLKNVEVGFVGLAAVVGHVYPVFFEFKGGKGAATAIGVLFGINFILGVIGVVIWLLVAKFGRYSSLASLVTVSFAPVFSILVTEQIGYFLPLVFIALLVAYKHSTNITRLMDGKEPKIQLKGPLLEDLIESPPHQTEILITEETVVPVATTPVVTTPVATKKAAVKKAPAKTVAAKKPAVKKTAAKKVTASKVAAEKKPAKKPAAKAKKSVS